MATGTKYIGEFFFLTILVYLMLGYFYRKISPQNLLLYGVIFAGIMIFTLILSNPPLLVPRKAKEYYDTLKWQSQMIQFGWGTKMEKGWYPWYQTLKHSFGNYLIFAISIVGCILGIIKLPQKRLLNVIILTWSIPLSLYLILFVANKAPRYFLPIGIPLFSCSMNFFQSDVIGKNRKLYFLSIFVVVSIYSVQIKSHFINNKKNYLSALQKEEKNPAIAFYHALSSKYLANVATVTIFRDPYVYIPPKKNWDVHMKWGATNYSDIENINPDLIVLQQSNITKYADDKIIIKSFNSETAKQAHEFYLDAKNDKLRGYDFLLHTSFGKAFVKRN